MGAGQIKEEGSALSTPNDKRRTGKKYDPDEMFYIPNTFENIAKSVVCPRPRSQRLSWWQRFLLRLRGIQV